MEACSNVFETYRVLAWDALAATPDGLWLDAGGGWVCEFGNGLNCDQFSKGVAVDISHEELQQNSRIPKRVQCDLNQPLPFADGSFTNVFSSRVIEHLLDPLAFIRECFRVLTPVGNLIVVLPTGRAPFSVIKRLLPHRVSRRLVTRFASDDPRQLCWATLYYRNCHPRALVRICHSAGFEIVNTVISYQQAQHFRGHALAYWPMKLYDGIARAIGAGGLAAYVLIAVRKPRGMSND